MSAATTTDATSFDGNGYSTFGFEFEPGSDGRMFVLNISFSHDAPANKRSHRWHYLNRTWTMNGSQTWQLNADAMGPNAATEVSLYLEGKFSSGILSEMLTLIYPDRTTVGQPGAHGMIYFQKKTWADRLTNVVIASSLSCSISRFRMRSKLYSGAKLNFQVRCSLSLAPQIIDPC